MEEQLELFSGQELKSLELGGIKISFRGIKVMKRDGRKVLLDVERIFNAIEKAFRSTFSEGEDPANPIMESLKIGNFVLDELKESVKNGKKVFTVEEIQDLVERKLYDYDIATYHNFHNY
jgi:ATP cone domain